MHVRMKAMKAYTIPFVGLKEGKHHFDYHIDNTFASACDYCRLYTSPSPRDLSTSRMPSSA